jgi:uncharacterized protein (DUF1697 family)
MDNLYLCLLRGINVGGKNLIKMADLAARFEAQGFTGVRTYIQSGNVIFRAAETDQARLAGQVEAMLSTAFNYDSRLVLRSHQELREVVAQAPHGFGSQPEVYRWDVIFLKEPLTAAEAFDQLTLKEGVDQAFAGQGVLYTSRLISRATQSRLSKMIGLPIYQYMTIRNWNTTTRLLQMMEADGGSG